MTTGKAFNQPLYDATVQAFFENGVPMKVAEAVTTPPNKIMGDQHKTKQ